MKVLITGATGLIGKKVAEVFLHNGFAVNFLTTSRKKTTALPGCFGYYWNPTQGYIDESALIGVDVIIHLAGETIAKRWTADQKQAIVESRVLPTRLLFRVLKNNPHQVSQIVAASAIGIYPNSTTTVYAEDETQKDNNFLGSVVDKWETSVSKFGTLGLKTCLLRTGLVLAENGGALPEMARPARLGFAAALGSGRQIYSWIHVDDLAAMYLFAVLKPLDGVFNAVAPNPVTNKFFTAKLAEVLRKPYFLPNIPGFVIRLMLGEMSELLLTGQNVSAQKLIDYGFEFQYPLIKPALESVLKK